VGVVTVSAQSGKFRSDDGSRLPGVVFQLHGIDVTAEAILQDLEIVDVFSRQESCRYGDVL
jgi:hypothetical protein